MKQSLRLDNFIFISFIFYVSRHSFSLLYHIKISLLSHYSLAVTSAFTNQISKMGVWVITKSDYTTKLRTKYIFFGRKLKKLNMKSFFLLLFKPCQQHSDHADVAKCWCLKLIPTVIWSRWDWGQQSSIVSLA